MSSLDFLPCLWQDFLSTFRKLNLICFQLLSIMEPVILGVGHSDFRFLLQIIILSLSSFLAMLGIYLFVNFIPETDKVIPFRSKVLEIMRGEEYLEILALIYGWSTIYISSGLAALRCVRVLRFLWYVELLSPFNPDKEELRPLSVKKTIQLAINYLEALAKEIFTQSSRGGVVVMALFFYLTYLVALVFSEDKASIETSEGRSCGTLSQCFITMLRLAFYDSTGLDYLSAVAQDSDGYAVLLFLFLICATFVLLNGLIGIFG